MPKLRSEGGLGLVELLIAMTVLQIAIFALISAFSSGHVALLRAGKTTTAAALASAKLESYRAGTYDSVPVVGAVFPYSDTTTEVGADGRSYDVIVDAWRECPNGTAASSDSFTCTAGGRPVKRVRVTVREAGTTRNLVTQTTVFDRLMGMA